jgi:hypothetical protein
MMVLGRRGEQERHARRPRMMIQNSTIDRAKESFCLGHPFVSLYVRPMPRCGSRDCCRAIDAVFTLGLASSFTYDIVYATREPCRGTDFVEFVSIALEQPRLTAVDTENLISVGRLQDPQKGLGVEAIRDDDAFGNRALKTIESEKTRARQDRKSAEDVIPEVIIVSQRVEGRQERSNVAHFILVQKRGADLSYEITKSNGVLQFFRICDDESADRAKCTAVPDRSPAGTCNPAPIDP